MDTIQEIIDDMRDWDRHPWMNEAEHKHSCAQADRLQKALDRKNRAIEHLNDPVVSMAQTRRLVELAKGM